MELAGQKKDIRELVLLRHGESELNMENRFTGWRDSNLSSRGVQEARRAGELLRNSGVKFDNVYASVFLRVIRTMDIVLATMGQDPLPKINFAWQLNERHYGGLQGLNKEETKKKYGEDQFRAWRRGFRAQPPEASEEERKNNLEALVARGVKIESVPATESLSDVLDRVLPYWNSDIVPKLKEGKKVLIVAHGNSLRALMKHLEHISDEGIADVEMPMGNPLIYMLDEDLNVANKKYLE